MWWGRSLPHNRSSNLWILSTASNYALPYEKPCWEPADPVCCFFQQHWFYRMFSLPWGPSWIHDWHSQEQQRWPLSLPPRPAQEVQLRMRWALQPASKFFWEPNGDFQSEIHSEKGRISKVRFPKEISQWKHLVWSVPVPHAKAVIFPMPFPIGKYPHENNSQFRLPQTCSYFYFLR